VIKETIIEPEIPDGDESDDGGITFGTNTIPGLTLIHSNITLKSIHFSSLNLNIFLNLFL